VALRCGIVPQVGCTDARFHLQKIEDFMLRAVVAECLECVSIETRNIGDKSSLLFATLKRLQKVGVFPRFEVRRFEDRLECSPKKRGSRSYLQEAAVYLLASTTLREEFSDKGLPATCIVTFHFSKK